MPAWMTGHFFWTVLFSRESPSSTQGSWGCLSGVQSSRSCSLVLIQRQSQRAPISTFKKISTHAIQGNKEHGRAFPHKAIIAEILYLTPFHVRSGDYHEDFAPITLSSRYFCTIQSMICFSVLSFHSCQVHLPNRATSIFLRWYLMRSPSLFACYS